MDYQFLHRLVVEETVVFAMGCMDNAKWSGSPILPMEG